MDMWLFGLFGLGCLILLFTPLILSSIWTKFPWSCKHEWNKYDNVTSCILCKRSYVFP